MPKQSPCVQGCALTVRGGPARFVPMRDAITEGIVLHLTNVGEAHRLVEVLTADGARRTAMARHARASKRRFSGALDAFATLRLHLKGTDEKLTLLSAVVQHGRLGLRQNLDALAQAATLVRCVRVLLPEAEACPPMYQILTWSLDMCAAGQHVAAAAAYPRLAQAAGILPSSDCGHCGRAQKQPWGLDQGMFVCSGCTASSMAWSHAVGESLRGAAVCDATTAQALQQCILRLVAWHTGKPQHAVAAML